MPDLKSRASGVDGIVVSDVHQPVRGGKYALIHEPSGMVIGIEYAFRTVRDAKATAQLLADLGPWDIAADQVRPRARAALAIIAPAYLAQRDPKRTGATNQEGAPSGGALPGELFRATSDGWCSCGLAHEDPLHPGWHHLWSWNTHVFTRAQADRDADFAERQARHERRTQSRVIVPQPAGVGP